MWFGFVFGLVTIAVVYLLGGLAPWVVLWCVTLTAILQYEGFVTFLCFGRRLFTLRSPGCRHTDVVLLRANWHSVETIASHGGRSVRAVPDWR